MRRYEKRLCPVCGTADATVSNPFTLQSKEYVIAQTFVQVACRGHCVKLNGSSRKTKGYARAEYRFRCAVPEEVA